MVNNTISNINGGIKKDTLCIQRQYHIKYEKKKKYQIVKN